MKVNLLLLTRVRWVDHVGLKASGGRPFNVETIPFLQVTTLIKPVLRRK